MAALTNSSVSPSNVSENMSRMQGVLNSDSDPFDDSKASDSELKLIGELREALTKELAELASQPENVSNWKLLRFLRGYSNDVERAAVAFKEMVDFRRSNNVNVR